MGYQDDPMSKALASRRGRGIDMSMILDQGVPTPPGQTPMGQTPMGQMAKPSGPTAPQYESVRDRDNGDLAPDPDGVLDVDHPSGATQEHPMMTSPLDGMTDADLLSGMSDYDKRDAMSRQPRSLGERARKEIILGATKK